MSGSTANAMWKTKGPPARCDTPQDRETIVEGKNLGN